MSSPRNQPSKLSKAPEEKISDIQLNYEQLRALKQLAKHGLSPKHFYQQDWFNETDHTTALSHLMTQRGALNMKAAQAIAELHELSYLQRIAIAEGFWRKDVIDLESYQLIALNRLHLHGLTPDQLLHQTWFDSHHHSCALKSLMINRGERNISAAQAMQEIYQLSFHQAGAIAKGLTRTDILELNKEQCIALGELHQHGLHRTHLLNKDWFNDLWYVEALKYLLTQCHLTPDHAMQEIDQLSSYQASAISAGFTRAGVVNLSAQHCHALMELHSHGLRRTHLEHCAWFDYIHAAALKHLMTRRGSANLNADDAMTLITTFKDNHSMLFIILEGGLTQQGLLHDILADKQIVVSSNPNDIKDGSIYTIIKNSNVIDLGTKLLYLKRAIKQDCYTFITSLDKLYRSIAEEKERSEFAIKTVKKYADISGYPIQLHESHYACINKWKEMINIITALKIINDMCFNNVARHTPNTIHSEAYETTPPQPILTRYFHDLRSNGMTFKLEPTSSQKDSRNIIRKNMRLLRAKTPIKAHKQVMARIALEKTMTPHTGWRALLKLPDDQLHFSPATAVVSTKKPDPLILASSVRSSSVLDSALPSPREEKLLFFSSKQAQPLNDAQLAALKQLANQGLTPKHFHQQDWFNHLHHAALNNLMTCRGDQNLSADEAMALITIFKDDPFAMALITIFKDDPSTLKKISLGDAAPETLRTTLDLR
jgi:hypothetical protein